jgi:FMN phosphatase YigB (HAD superfamily)
VLQGLAQGEGKKMIWKSVLIDLDGALWDSAATYRAVAKTQYAQYVAASMPGKLGAWRQAFTVLCSLGLPREEVYARLGRRFGLRLAVQDQLVRDWEETLPRHVAALPGARDLLENLRARHFKVALISMGRKTRVRAIVAALEFQPLIDHIVSSGDTGARKPHRKLFAEALATLDCGPEASIVIGGDHDLVLAPAKAAGMTCVQRLAPGALPGAAACFASESLREISGFVLRRLAEFHRAAARPARKVGTPVAV